jgi:cathepsin A (carboxypeptidase C)
MRAFSAALLVGAATAASPAQQVLGGLKDLGGAIQGTVQENLPKLKEPLGALEEQLESLSDEARGLWEEVAAAFPDSLGHNPVFSLPKKHTRRPDSHWDHIVRGADVQSVWVTNSEGEKEREIDGKLEAYDLRVKKTDPESLGIDPHVKQYTGYLDDNENDKHLFYCKLFGVVFWLFMD